MIVNGAQGDISESQHIDNSCVQGKN